LSPEHNDPGLAGGAVHRAGLSVNAPIGP